MRCNSVVTIDQASHVLSLELSHVCNMTIEAGGRRQELGHRGQEAGGRRQEAGARTQGTGDRRQELGHRGQKAEGRTETGWSSLL